MAPPGETCALELPSESLTQEWDRLADELAAPPFMRPGWILAWAEAFAARSPVLLCLRRDGVLAGITPLRQRGGRVRSPTNWHTPVFGALVRDEEARAALVGRLLTCAPASLDLGFLDAGDPLVAALREVGAGAGRRAIIRTVLRSPYVDLAGRSWEEYVVALPGKVRKEAGRLRRRLEEQGPVEFEFSHGGDRLEDVLSEGFAIEASGWKERQGTAIVSDRAAERFYRSVARWAAERGELRLCFLRLDGRPLAFDLCLQSAGVMYALKGGFEPGFRRYGPGMLLTYETLRRAFADGLHSYELLGDADPYKLTWTQALRERVRVQLFNARSAAGLSTWLAWRWGRPAAARLRSAGSGVRERP